MKKFLLILFVLVGALTQVKAQDRIQALKIAFITKRLQLTPDEAQRFWPIYNQYDKEMQQAEMQGGDAIPKEEALLNIRKKYLPSFQRVIGPEKTNTLFNAETEFRNILIRRLQNRSQQMRTNRFRR